MNDIQRVLQEIRDVSLSIIKNEWESKSSDYINHRQVISNLFLSTKYDKYTIMMRLVAIDSLYSTNAGYCYFSFEEMSEAIYGLGSQEEDAKRYFYNIACGNKDDKGLFSKEYGFYKNLSRGSQQMSLLSKYAYYSLLVDKEKYPIGFPIYDSLAKFSYKKIAKTLGLAKCSKKLEGSIEEYIEVLDNMRKLVFDVDYNLFNGYQQFDMLDAYLWRMGKFSNGNLSLLIDKDDYKLFVKNMKLDFESNKEDENSTYKDLVIKRMKKEYPNEWSINDANNNKNIFNESVIFIFKDKNTNPFTMTSKEVYITTLLNHWRNYYVKQKQV